MKMLLGRLYRASIGLPMSSIRSMATGFNKHLYYPKASSNFNHWGAGANIKWPLIGDIYRVGGRIARASQHQNFSRNGNTGTLTYGSWGIPLQLDTSQHPIFLPNLWLRDNCRCEKCVNPDTMQRAFDSFSLPSNIVPNEVVTERLGLKITWPGDDSHVSFYPWNWIVKNIPATQKNQNSENDVNCYTLWDSKIQSNEPLVSYDEIMKNDHGVGQWTSKIRQFGFCYVDGCPISPEKTKALVERIAFIRETHYGGFYDFTSDLTMKDTAYTTLALPLHTDTTYFTDPAGLQMFHLLSHEHGDGGASVLVDGFNSAKILKSKFPAKYEILCSKPVHAHAVGNQGITIKPAKMFPVLGVIDPTLPTEEPELYQIRWNNDDRGVVPLENDDNRCVDAWYDAARSFNEILNLESMQYKTQLKPGRPLSIKHFTLTKKLHTDCTVFDNWRVLHGRTAFTGKRRICGAYVNHDDYISRWRNTNFTREQVLQDVL